MASAGVLLFAGFALPTEIRGISTRLSEIRRCAGRYEPQGNYSVGTGRRSSSNQFIWTGSGGIPSRRVLTADSPIRDHHPTAQACAAGAPVRRQNHMSRVWRLRRERGGPVHGHPRRGYETSSSHSRPKASHSRWRKQPSTWSLTIPTACM